MDLVFPQPHEVPAVAQSNGALCRGGTRQLLSRTGTTPDRLQRTRNSLRAISRATSTEAAARDFYLKA